MRYGWSGRWLRAGLPSTCSSLQSWVFSPSLPCILTKLIVDSVTAGLATPEPATAFPQVLLYILIAAVIALVLALARSLSELTSEAQSMIVTDGVSDILHAQSIAVDLEYYEDTEIL